MSIDALPVFLLILFWRPLLYVAGAVWCFCVVFAIWGAFNRIFSNSSE